MCFIRTKILFILFFLFARSAFSIDFDYYSNPVTALSEIGYPEETQVLSNSVFRTLCGHFQILPDGADPRTSYTLSFEEGRYPIIRYEMPCNGGRAFVTAFASVMPNSQKVAYKASTINLRGEFEIIKIRNLINFIRIQAENKSDVKRDFHFQFSYSFGAGIPMQVDYQSKEFIYYDWKGRHFDVLEDRRTFGEGKEVLFASSHNLAVSGGGAKISISLDPAEKKDIHLFLPYFSMTRADAQALLSAPDVWQKYYDAKRKFWDDRRAQAFTVFIPEKKPMDVFYASHWYLLETCLDNIGKRWILRANPFQYDQFYMRDGTFQARAMDLLGEHEIAKKCLDFFIESRDNDGRLASQPEQYDANGMALYAIGQHVLLTKDKTWAKRVLPAVRKSVRWLEKYRNGGLMPPSSMNDNEMLKNARLVGHNIWAANGLFHAFILAQTVDAKEFMDETGESSGKYVTLLINELQKFDRIPPSFEYMDAEAYAPGRFGMKYGFDWGNLSMIYTPFDIWDFPIMTNTLDYCRKYYREGLFPYPERGYEDQLHHYLSFDITLTSLVRREYNDVLNDFYTGYLLHTTNCHAGCERFDRRTRDYIPPSNITPHGTFAAKYIALFRNFFVMEHHLYDKKLRLCSFLAPDWCAAGAQIKVERAPTVFGRISFHLDFFEENALLQISPPKAERDFNGYIFYLPPFLEMTKALSDGRDLPMIEKTVAAIPFGRYVEIPSNARRVEIFFKRNPAPNVNYEKTVQKYISKNRQP